MKEIIIYVQYWVVKRKRREEKQRKGREEKQRKRREEKQRKRREKDDGNYLHKGP